jgi:AraC-like DNA-binding protein
MGPGKPAKEEFRAIMGHSMLSALRERAPGGVSVVFPKDRYRLHAMVTSAGYDRCTDPGYDWHGLRRGDAPFVLLQHTIGGRGHLRVERRRWELRPGQTMLLRFPQDNRYWLGRNPEWEFFWLCLNGREVLRVWREVIAAHGPVVTLPEAAVERLAASCLSALQGEAASPARASALAYGAAMGLAEELLPWGEMPAASPRPAAIERAVSLCAGQPAERIDVARMAKASGYSRYHFSRVFAAHEGTTPARYLLRLRMEEAARLLHVEEAPVKVIAQRCGFDDANYFAKVFRRFYGIGPRDFRRSGMYAGTVQAGRGDA